MFGGNDRGVTHLSRAGKETEYWERKRDLRFQEQAASGLQRASDIDYLETQVASKREQIWGLALPLLKYKRRGLKI